MLNLKHLYYFYIFAQELKTAQAAKRLGITAPALSNQLKQLEEFLGSPLTKRSKGKVVFSESGEMVLHYAERMFSAYSDLQNRLSSHRNPNCSQFRVGVCEYIGAQFAFDLLSHVVKTHLSLSKKVHITFDSSERILGEFKKDQFDLVISASVPEVNGESAWISQDLSFPVRLFAPPKLMEGVKTEDQKFVRTDLTRLIELANSRKISLVVPAQPSVLRDETDKLLLHSNVVPSRIIESNSCSAIVQLIDRGFAMGFVPIPCLLDFRSAATLIALGPPRGYWKHSISIFIQKGEGRFMAKISPLAEMFSPESKFV